MEEITKEDIERYSSMIGCFVSVDYITSDEQRRVAKGRLDNIKNNKLLITDINTEGRFWEVHISSIKNLNSKPLREKEVT